MSEKKPWAFELEEYIREGEPTRAEKAKAWAAAIGLQDVDGLQVSDYLVKTAKDNIEGRIDHKEALTRIDSYYEEQRKRGSIEERQEEADKVSARIAELLSEKAFQFSPVYYMSIHKNLFNGIFKGAGEARPYNISKKEWVLNGDTVLYASHDLAWESLKYDFEQERAFDYSTLTPQETLEHLARFISRVWQIHPFLEGNTRTTAVFLIKYLRSLGFEVNNDPFEENSWYFRNALVRANYNNYPKGIHETTIYLERFLDNLLNDANNELKNRFIHVDWADVEADEGASGITDGETQQVTQQATQQVARLVEAVGDDTLSLKEIMQRLGLADRNNVMKNYVNPALQAGVIERTVPDKPNSRLQQYRKTMR